MDWNKHQKPETDKFISTPASWSKPPPYIEKNGVDFLTFYLYVDGLIYSCAIIMMMEEFKKMMQEFMMTDLGFKDIFLALNINKLKDRYLLVKKNIIKVL